MEVPPTLLKVGAGAGLLTLGKPKLKDAATPDGKTGRAGLVLSIDPKSFCSYSCNCL